ncbi:hypothetical protein [Asticcacaulis endophyticus]|uniref:Uncharacterized protein n=1 Tax=Asticcacaulis endophyticus TaxID=1395890 RepID=A0A918QF26_9CAUL|nr:hypothetical protein [Asticcacaulis endophyticus]GGZ45364.1 hypothetical protein GCM10011273_35090 [Asticcacaulis endophyticus]
MIESISERLIDQRHRNRIIEEVHSLTLGIGSWGAAEYFNAFYDHMNDDEPWQNSAMTEEEWCRLNELCQLMNKACDSTPGDLTDQELIDSGWPDRIKPDAQKVLDVFLKRGRFSEEFEQEAPSYEAGQTWLSLCWKL